MDNLLYQSNSQEDVQTALTKKEDSRVVRTKCAIRQSFYELLKQKPFEQITISDVARGANISRKTFYAHYANLDALLEDRIREFLSCLYANLLKNNPQAGIEEYALTFVRNCIEGLYATSEVNRNLIEATNSSSYVKLVCKTVIDHVQDLCLRRSMEIPDSLDVTVGFILSGLTEGYRVAIAENDYQPLSAQRIEELIVQIQSLVHACVLTNHPELAQ